MKKNTVYTLGSLIILLICAFCFVVLPAVEGRSSRQQGADVPAFGKYNGKEIKYAVAISDVSGYTKKVTGSVADGRQLRFHFRDRPAC